MYRQLPNGIRSPATGCTPSRKTGQLPGFSRHWRDLAGNFPADLIKKKEEPFTGPEKSASCPPDAPGCFTVL
jgi:hypothetical protein